MWFETFTKLAKFKTPTSLYYLHHTSACEHGVVDRIRADVSILTLESNCYHNKVVDVVQIATYNFFSMPRTGVANDKISGGANGYFIGD